jgi:hypothetical protein
MIGAPPNCKPLVKLKLKCPSGTSGVFPNCKNISGRERLGIRRAA